METRILGGGSFAALAILTWVVAGVACDTRNVGRMSGDLYQLTCINSGPDWEMFGFGEVEVGLTRQSPFDASNESTLYVRLGDNDFQAIELSSRIRLSGFTVAECSAGDPSSFAVEGPFPVDLGTGEWQPLTVEFAPTSPGEHQCTLEPQYDFIVQPDPKGHTIERTVDRCTVRAIGTALPAPGPACVLEPATAVVEFGDVEVGSEFWQSLTIRNQTPNPIATNRFFYAFDNPTNDCVYFSMSPDDSSGVIGPAGSGGVQIPVRFSPDSDRSFQCVRDLSSLSEPGGSEITNACPSAVTWTGRGLPAPRSWTACSPTGTSLDFHAVTGLSADEVYVAGDAGAVLTPSGDCQWEYAGTGFGEVDLRDLWVHEEGGQKALWAVGSVPPPQGFVQGTGVALYSDGSNWSDWTRIDEDGLLTFEAVWGSGFDDVYFAGLGVSSDFPNAKRFTGDPQNLEEFIISIFGMSEVRGLSGTAADDVWAVLHEPWNAVYRFRGGSPSDPWEDMTPPFTPISRPNDIGVRKGDGWEAVYAVGEEGAIYHFDGQEWLADESIAGEEGDFHGVWVSPTGTVFAVGEGPMIYKGHVNEPGQWTRQTIPATAFSVGDVLLDVWGTDDDNVYAVGTSGVILRYRPEVSGGTASR